MFFGNDSIHYFSTEYYQVLIIARGVSKDSSLKDKARTKHSG